MLPASDTDRDEVEALADEFVERQRRGESPDIEDYATRCPGRADEIRELFPAIAAIERWKPRPRFSPSRAGASFPPSGRLGDLRLIREIGRGGMGVVYEAEQESLGRRVAVKVLPHAPWSEDDRPIRRFLREAQTTANLRHGNIVPVFSVGREGELHYYVMPLIAGAGLDHVLRELRRRSEGPAKIAAIDDAGRLAMTILDGTYADLSSPPTRAEAGPWPIALAAETPIAVPRAGTLGASYWRCVARIGRQAAEALQHAHDQGVLHRDVKPANLLLDGDGVVWVSDFGLAKAAHHDDLSRTGDLLGTLRYMPPERFRGESDARGDIFSLGLTLYELLTLRPAYDSADGPEALRMMTEAAPPRPRTLDPAIPRDLETIVVKAIDPEPGRRYQTAVALADDLGRFDQGLPILARKAPRRERLWRWIKRNRGMAALAAMTTVLAMFAAYFFALWVMAPPHPRPHRPEDPITPSDLATPFRPGPPPFARP